MDAFLGTWKLVEKTHLDEYLKAVGIEEQISYDKLTETISKEGDNVVWKKTTSQGSREIKFKLDKVFHDGTLHGRQCFSTITLDKNQLVQVRKWGRNESTVVREVKGNKMIMTLKFGGVEAQCIYEKV